MKIVRIETVRAPEHPCVVWVQVHTDDGLVGLGETFHIPGAVEAVIHDYMAPLLLGQSAFDRERHWQNFFAYASFFGHCGAEMRAISALDIALWDLFGQYLGQPIFNLIGGRSRERIPVYNTCVNTRKFADQDAFLKNPGELAKSLVEQGYLQMKVWPWDRFAPQIALNQESGAAGWTAVGPPGRYLTAADLKAGLWVVEEIRRAVGDRIAIAIEGHSRWDLNCAIRIARAVEPYDVVWMEDIMQTDSVDDLARLAHETRSPQAVSERRLTKFSFREIMERKAARVAMLDIVWTGGLTEAVKIAAIADAYHLSFTTHDCTGPINVFAASHLCAAAPNAMIQEVVRGFVEDEYLDVTSRPVPIREGHVVFDDLGPGLGVTLRADLLKRSDLVRRVSTAR